MRYLILLCASGTTLGGGVRDPIVSGSVRSAGPLLANSHLLMLEPNFFSFLQSLSVFLSWTKFASLFLLRCQYLAWYLVQDQEDEYQSAAAVFLSNFCSPGGFADKHLSLKHLTSGKILPVARVGFFLLYCNIEPADPHVRHHF
ncbi:hypothetical protein T02_4140 [Trichinella nativa]|uniref:Uncharacterized protein n=1 Tax=Trichinella nativa TaxID=6335 RepID=A0A0V1LV75_9BILA|nr:hypothetical protein T02_4140 [Trichinella nativa]